MPNLNKMYQPNRNLKVPELNAVFEITSQGTPYLKTDRGNQKVGFLLMRTRLLIDHQYHTIMVKQSNNETNNFDYTIQKQKPIKEVPA